MEAVSAIAGSNINTNPTPELKTQQFDKIDFMKLLIAQLQNQDPLEPLDNNQFVAQMTDFSSLEQLGNIDKSVNGLGDLLTNNGNLLNGGAMLLHQEVSILNGLNEEVGLVDKIRMQDNKLEVSVNGNWFDSSLIREVRVPTTNLTNQQQQSNP